VSGHGSLYYTVRHGLLQKVCPPWSFLVVQFVNVPTHVPCSLTCLFSLIKSHNGYGTLCPSSWTSLPLQLREPEISFNRSKLYWRRFCFRWRGALWLVVKSAAYKYAYLLTYFYLGVQEVQGSKPEALGRRQTRLRLGFYNQCVGPMCVAK